MALKPPVIVGLYPDVPFVRGVPQLRRSPTVQQIQILAFATAAITGRLWQMSRQAPQWGIFRMDDATASTRRRRLFERQGLNFRINLPGTEEVLGTPVISADSVLDFGNRNESRVSDFPVQQGAFASYNKVAVPFEVVVRLSKSGNVADRATFLQQIDAASKTLVLYRVVTPERTYENMNLIRYEVTRRGASGAYFLTDVDVYFREIREVAAQYSTTVAATRNAQEASAVPAVSQGVRQAETLPNGLAWP